MKPVKVGYKRSKYSPELLGWLLSLPAVVIFFSFYIGPAVLGLWISLFKWDGITTTMDYIGLENYGRLIQDPRFWNSLWVNLLLLSLSLLLIMPLALLIAVALSKRGFGMTFFRNAIFLPQILSVATIALIWDLMYDPYHGFINKIPQFVGAEKWNIAWLGDKNLVLLSVFIIIYWSSVGFHVILFLAGLAGIPEEYIDAARLETSSNLDILRYVTIPLLRETIFISFVVIVGSSFGHKVGLVFLSTFGGPSNRTELMALYSYLIAFKGHQFGYSSAISVIVLVLVLILVVRPAIRLARERLEY